MWGCWGAQDASWSSAMGPLGGSGAPSPPMFSPVGLFLGSGPPDLSLSHSYRDILGLRTPQLLFASLCGATVGFRSPQTSFEPPPMGPLQAQGSPSSFLSPPLQGRRMLRPPPPPKPLYNPLQSAVGFSLQPPTPFVPHIGLCGATGGDAGPLFLPPYRAVAVGRKQAAALNAPPVSTPGKL